MGRVLRKKSAKGNCENFSPKPQVQKSNLNVLDSFIKPVKSVLCDRTNTNASNVPKVKDEKPVKFNEHKENSKVKSCLKSSNLVHNSDSGSPVLRKSKRINSAKEYIVLTPIKLTNNGNEGSENIKVSGNKQIGKYSQRTAKNIHSFAEENKDNVDKINKGKGFPGFETAEKSPLLDILRNKLDLHPEAVQPLSVINKKNHLPIYRSNKPSPPKMGSNSTDDRLHLYDFEIDENEPVAKKGKRKPILKIKRCRTYNRKKKMFTTPKKLNESNQENVCPNIQPNTQTVSKGYAPLSPISERSIPDVFDNSMENVVDTSVGPSHSHVENIPHSTSSNHASQRDSLVPIIRTSVSQINDDYCSKSLNASACSSRHDISVNSAYTEHFNSPLYIGSSTPIHRHWAEQTNHVNSNVTSILCEKFDISNNFGFADVDLVEEPIVSPIKRFETPIQPITPKKPSPNKIPHQQVIRMLKFGPEASINFSLDDESLPIDELLPSHFFHDGDTPTFSPPSSPVTPVFRKKGAKNNRPGKKKVVIVEDLEDSDFATQSSEDRTSQEEYFRCERTLRSNQTLPRRVDNNQTLSKTMKFNQTLRRTGRNACKDDSDIEKDKGYETEISPTKQNITKKTRRSYERPVYLRSKKFGKQDLEEDDDDEEEEEEEEVVKKEKAQPKKRNARSKKEEMELEKWAQAFNAQCMQVENFNLVVE